MTSTQHAAVTELGPWHTHTLDIRECDRVEFLIGVLPHEKAGMRPETWPGHARTTLNKAVEEWLAERGIAAVRAITYGAVICGEEIQLAMIVHYVAAPPPAAPEPNKPSAQGIGAGDAPPPDHSSPPAAAPIADRCRIGGCGE